LNPDTLVVVCCYQGDADLVERALSRHQRFGRVLVLSPENSSVAVPGVKCRSAGKSGWAGPHTILRQIEHWRVALQEPEDWFLTNDADSVCLAPVLPDELFTDERVLWANAPVWKGVPTAYLRPPYFCHRRVLEQLIIADPKSYDETGYIDYWVTKTRQLLHIPFRALPECACAFRTDLVEAARGGAAFLHGARTVSWLEECMKAYDRRR
jgi:hypothetical protein